jgi:hypothetical protein
VINVVTSIEIPLPAASGDADDSSDDLRDQGPLAA